MYSTSQLYSLDNTGLQANPAEALLANAAFHTSNAAVTTSFGNSECTMMLPRTPVGQSLVGSGVRTSLVLCHGGSASHWKGGWDEDAFLVEIVDFLACGYVTCICWGFPISCCSFWHLVACQQMSTWLTDYPFVKMEIKSSMRSLCLHYPPWKLTWKLKITDNLKRKSSSSKPSLFGGCIYQNGGLQGDHLHQYVSPQCCRLVSSPSNVAEKSHHGTPSFGASILSEARMFFFFGGCAVVSCLVGGWATPCEK